MSESESRVTACGVPEWFGIPENNTAAYINDVLLALVNVPSCCFAVCSNLFIIVTIMKTPSLQKPCNILLCSLAATDCLTGLTSQPIFVALRLMIQHVLSTCKHQHNLFSVFFVSTMLMSGWSFTFITVISFDRHYALSRPIAYRTSVTNKGTLKAIALTGVSWFLLTILAQLAMSTLLRILFSMATILMFIGIPTANHIRMFLAIRRHNIRIRNSVEPLGLTVVLRRERKVALDMFVISLVLLLSLIPSMLNKPMQVPYPRVYSTLQPWTLSMVFLMSSLNPLIYTLRNKALRDAMKSVLFKAY